MHTTYLLRGFRLVGRLRLLLSLFAALILMPAALGETVPVEAQQTPFATRDADRRLQIEVKSITIINDKDWGEGEFTFTMFVRPLLPGCSPWILKDQCTLPEFMSHAFRLRGHDLDDLDVDQMIPNADTDLTLNGRYIHALAGFPVYPDETYSIRIHGHEDDLIVGEYMGTAALHLTPENSWGRGITRVRASRDDGKTNEGDFEVLLEIRDAPLPDLRPTSLKVINLPGSAEKLVCAGMLNSGAVDAPPFVVSFQINGATVAGAQASAGKLASGQNGELCIQLGLPTTGRVMLSAFVDSARGIDEVSDTNNRIELPYGQAVAGAGAGSDSAVDQPTPVPASTPTAPTSSPSSQAPVTPGTGTPDLLGTALLVNGRVPDGKNDCKEGKNTITVRAKNAGTADAGSFVVQLKIGGLLNEQPTQTVKGLAAGQERDVRFEGIKLTKGEHLMSATVDSKNTITESDESNNELTASPTCKDDD